jgi:tetratricopeptide (TPR) repeat protein
MIRVDPNGVLGWQFRRYDDRFGDKQAKKVEEAVRRAALKCTTEDGRRLIRFALWANIDLEPGHGKQTGERERFAKLKKKVADELGVELEFEGISQVHAQLLMHPTLRPGLFENVAAQVAALSETVHANQEEIKKLVTSVVADAAAKGSLAVQRLVEQAGIHFERGRELGSQEDFRSAIRCLNDALSLLVGFDADDMLEGRIYMLLAGIQRLLGNLPAAEKAGREAVAKLVMAPSDDLAHARGNLALVLRDQQRYAESRSLLLQTLDHFERTGEQLEIVRTLTHLLELCCNRGDSQDVLRWRDRLRPALTKLERDTGITDVSVSATGALASGILMLAIAGGDTAALQTAETLFASVEALSRKNGKRMLTVAAIAQRASAVRYQDRLAEAVALYQQAKQEAEAADLQKIAADSLFNEAIVHHEMGERAQAIEQMNSARDRYRQLGDHASENDAADSAGRWSRGED